jgi:alkylated DNA nucleotide flippase Atl1
MIHGAQDVKDALHRAVLATATDKLQGAVAVLQEGHSMTYMPIAAEVGMSNAAVLHVFY